jgi:hypothetical protein
MAPSRSAALAVIAFLLAACASGGNPSGDAGRGRDGGGGEGGSGEGGMAGDGSPGEGGLRDGAPGDDGSPADVPVDTFDPCAGIACGPFERCDPEMGVCEPYDPCVSDAECAADEVCRHRFCIPRDADPDGDGSSAGMDCDETNPAIHAGATEVCNSIDDDCNMMADDGDPGTLCAMDPAGGICIMGGCGCPAGTFDIDRIPTNGCECMAAPGPTTGVACADAIDVGDLSDVGQTVNVTGNVLPDGREIWYRFRAVDAADTTCDNFHVRARFTTNPGDAFAIMVFVNACDMAACDASMLYTQFDWATDFRDAAGNGECPCGPEPSSPGANFCNDNTQTFYVRVTRRPGATVTCDAYTLELTNGVYDT